MRFKNLVNNVILTLNRWFYFFFLKLTKLFNLTHNFISMFSKYFLCNISNIFLRFTSLRFEQCRLA